MLNRSNVNYTVALLLLNKKDYDGSVVAFYYSVLQRMMFSLNKLENNPLSYENQSSSDEDMHAKVLSEITNRINNQREKANFITIFNHIRELRNKADYNQDSVTLDDCLDCRNDYAGLISRLNRFFPASR